MSDVPGTSSDRVDVATAKNSTYVTFLRHSLFFTLLFNKYNVIWYRLYLQKYVWLGVFIINTLCIIMFIAFKNIDAMLIIRPYI